MKVSSKGGWEWNTIRLHTMGKHVVRRRPCRVKARVSRRHVHTLPHWAGNTACHRGGRVGLPVHGYTWRHSMRRVKHGMYRVLA